MSPATGTVRHRHSITFRVHSENRLFLSDFSHSGFYWKIPAFLVPGFTERFRLFFFVQTEPVGRGLYRKTEVRYFSVHTEQARLIKSLLYDIYAWEKQEMDDLKKNISSVVRTHLVEENKKYQCIPSFPLKTTLLRRALRMFSKMT
jgi:hypothetical protein